METSWKKLIPEVAQKMKMSEEEVEKQIMTYSRALQSEMQEMTNYRYEFFKLGIIYPRFDKLKKTLLWAKIKKFSHLRKMRAFISILPQLYIVRPGLKKYDSQFDPRREELELLKDKDKEDYEEDIHTEAGPRED